MIFNPGLFFSAATDYYYSTSGTVPKLPGNKNVSFIYRGKEDNVWFSYMDEYDTYGINTELPYYDIKYCNSFTPESNIFNIQTYSLWYNPPNSGYAKSITRYMTALGDNGRIIYTHVHVDGDYKIVINNVDSGTFYDLKPGVVAYCTGKGFSFNELNKVLTSGNNIVIKFNSVIVYSTNLGSSWNHTTNTNYLQYYTKQDGYILNNKILVVHPSNNDLYFTNSIVNWSNVTSTVTAVNKRCSISLNTGYLYVGGSDSKLFRSENDGASWTDISSGVYSAVVGLGLTSGRIFDLQSVDDSIIITVSDFSYGVVLKSNDKGVTFTNVSEVYNKILISRNTISVDRFGYYNVLLFDTTMKIHKGKF